MPTDEVLIEDPLLDGREEAARIAARIHRSIGNLTVDVAQLIIDYGEALKAMIEASGAVSEPLLPELSSARAPEAHVALLTEVERAFTETHYRFNQLPDKVRIALLRLMGITLQPAVAASCTMQFTKIEDFLEVEVEVPADTQVRTEDRQVYVSTVAELVIPAGQLTGTVEAKATAEGDIRSSAGSIGVPITSLAGILSVTNTTSLTGGSAAESVDQGKIRAREEFRLGRHLGSINDYESYIYFEILRRKGRVTGFERYVGDFSKAALGYALMVLQGGDGLAPSDDTLNAVAAVINQRHIAGLYIAVRAPLYKAFGIAASVVIAPGQSQSTLINKAKKNLVDFFDPLRFEYGPGFPDRFISISDIVGAIEAASPRLISVGHAGNVFDITLTIAGKLYQEDIPLGIGELPLLGTVTLTVV